MTSYYSFQGCIYHVLSHAILPNKVSRSVYERSQGNDQCSLSPDQATNQPMRVGVSNVIRGYDPTTTFDSQNAPIGNASRSNTSSQKRSPHTSGVLEDTRKPMSKQVTREISHDRTAEDAASSSSAAASTPPSYHYVNRRNTEGSYSTCKVDPIHVMT